jgi:hypothetical protein
LEVDLPQRPPDVPDFSDELANLCDLYLHYWEASSQEVRAALQAQIDVNDALSALRRHTLDPAPQP